MTAHHPYDHHPPSSTAWMWLCGAIALATLPHFLHLSLWVPSASLSLLAWRAWLTHKHHALPPKWLLMVLMVGSIGGIALTHHTIVGLNAGVSLLSLMLSLKLLEAKSLRDAMISVFLGYFVTVTQFFFDQEIYSAVYLLLVALVMTAALITLNENSAPIERRQKLRLAGSLLLQAVPIMIVLFFLFPRLPNPLWAMPAPDTSSRTGLSDRMSPGKISDLLQSDQTAFRVEFDGALPANADLYWRGPVLWDYDGVTWTRPERLPFHRAPVEDEDEWITYTITLEPTDQPWLLSLDVPVDLPPKARLMLDYQVITDKPITELKRYRMSSITEHPFDYQLSPGGRQRLLYLPPNTAPQAQALAQQWLAQEANQRGVVGRALRHFREQEYFYTLKPPLLNNDITDQFLFESRRGFCEHYASSFVVLMRHAGIPARVVTGYQGGEYNEVGDYLRVRQSDAHAWAEVWFDDEGWVRVDPTAAVAPERVEQGINAALSQDTDLPMFLRGDFSQSLLGQLRLGWDSMRYFWNNWVVFYDTSRQANLLKRLGINHQNIGDLLVAMLVAMGGLMGAYGLLFWWQQRHRSKDRIERQYRRFLTRCARLGVQRQKHEGALDFARRVKAQHPELSEWVDAVQSSYTALRYAHQPSSRIGELKQAVDGFYRRS